jgi:hypothetical protein
MRHALAVKLRCDGPLGPVMLVTSLALSLLAALSALSACASSRAPDPRHAARPEGCAVKSFAETPNVPIDELGVVDVDCAGQDKCSRKLLDEVCARGGDIVWGLGENAITGKRMKGHAAHSASANFGPRAKGCEVLVRADAPVEPTENIGPVSATCGEETSDDECTRALQDEACRLGADVVWGVGAPLVRGTKKTMSGRAAHTKPH